MILSLIPGLAKGLRMSLLLINPVGNVSQKFGVDAEEMKTGSIVSKNVRKHVPQNLGTLTKLQ